MFQLLLILAIKLFLYLSARATLPWLFGQARHASLENGSTSLSSLPEPATSSASSYNASSGSLHHDYSDSDSAPFLSTSKSRSNPTLLNKVKSAVLSPVRIRNTHGHLDLASFSALIFSLSFEESSSLFMSVLLEQAGFSSGYATALRYSWRFSIFAVLGLAIVFIPLGICFLFTYRINTSTPIPYRIAYLSVPFIPWLVLFFKVPLPAAMTSPGSKIGLLESLLARTAIIGVVLIAMLSGSAAVAAAWEAGQSLRGKAIRPPSQSEARLANESFSRTCSDLANRKSELERLEAEAVLERQSDTSRGWSLSGLWGGDDRSREIKALKSEIFGLSAIASAMRDDLDRMKVVQKKDERSKTVGGRLVGIIGWGWAAYCAFRVVLSLLNLLVLGYKENAPPDFISYAIAHLIKIFDVDVDVSVWTRQISLIFVGFLIWGRIGSVLSYLSSVFRAASTGVSTSFLVLFLAEVMTIYLLAILIQLRSSLPPSLSNPPAPAPPPPSFSSTTTLIPSQQQPPFSTPSPPLLATLPSFQVIFGSLFDTFFLLAGLITAVYKYFLETQTFAIGDGGALFTSNTSR